MHSLHRWPVAALLLLAVSPPSFACADDYHALVSHSTAKQGREWELGMTAGRGAWPSRRYEAWWVQRQLEKW